MSTKRVVDAHTVRKVQLRAPKRSRIDREYIKEGIESGEFFPSVIDHEER